MSTKEGGDISGTLALQYLAGQLEVLKWNKAVEGKRT